jgi:hypothetical protein
MKSLQRYVGATMLLLVAAVPACSPDKCFDGPISASGENGFYEQAQALCRGKGLYLHTATGGAGRLDKVCCYR